MRISCIWGFKIDVLYYLLACFLYSDRQSQMKLLARSQTDGKNGIENHFDCCKRIIPKPYRVGIFWSLCPRMNVHTMFVCVHSLS